MLRLHKLRNHILEKVQGKSTFILPSQGEDEHVDWKYFRCRRELGKALKVLHIAKAGNKLLKVLVQGDVHFQQHIQYFHRDCNFSPREGKRAGILL